MGVTQRQTQQLQPRRLREWVPGSFLLHIQTSTFSSTSQTPRTTTTVKMAVSKIRQNYHEDCEALINKQINMEFQTKRGGRVVFQDIAKPTTMEWGTPLEVMEAALELEKTVNQSLLDLHKVAGDKGDGHLCDFLESEYLGEQVEGIKAIGDLITKMKRAGDGLGLHLIDEEMGS